LLQFLEGKSPQAQSGHGFLLLQIEDIAVVENNARIKPIPLKVAAPTQDRWLKPSESTEKRCGNFWRVKALKRSRVKVFRCCKSKTSLYDIR
jgi:hypothetical protein